MSSSNLVTIIDYGMGNIGSLINMFKRIGVLSEVASDVRSIKKAKKVLLPGVGAFGPAMDRIDELDLREILREKALSEKVPFMGICLGMQLLTRSSEESDSARGLDLIPAETVRFPRQKELRVPHMGWNEVSIVKPTALTNDLPPEPRFYFVHSYFVRADDADDVILRCRYGDDFDAAVNRGNIFGAQFHPEKSHKFGMALLRSFAEI
ncbi:imidazole glycerol phosphate synthase subunit HisH [Cognatishimia sp. D5M38]|uniref:Imidazole glycerol phosphate synthase subunit HisH n=1 Tax=Cognatishimia coralii TaxID=3083254 RepID=A0ABU8QKW0_9RHOB